MISFTIPGEVVPQSRPRATIVKKKIRMYDKKESKDYKQYVSLIAKQYASRNLLEAPLGVSIKIYRQIPKSTPKKDRALIEEGIKHNITKPDVDNSAKAILDSLNGVIYKDDSQVVDLHVSKHYSDNPRVEVVILELDLHGHVDMR